MKLERLQSLENHLGIKYRFAMFDKLFEIEKVVNALFFIRKKSFTQIIN